MLGPLYSERHALGDSSVAAESAALYHGDCVPEPGPVPTLGSDAYFHERSVIEGMLIAGVARELIVPVDSPLGWRFAEVPPANAAESVETLGNWVQEQSHHILDEQIESDPRIRRIADRYQDLVRPDLWIGQQSQPTTRREVLMFDQAISEPHTWLHMGAIVAHSFSLEITPQQALPFTVARLDDMYLSARRDVAIQYVRGAVADAAFAFGQVVIPGDTADTAHRYQWIRNYVQHIRGHRLRANRFTELYAISDHPQTGIELEERLKGFGKIIAVRRVPLGCPAMFSMNRRGRRDTTGRAALLRLMPAGIVALDEAGLLEQAVQTAPTETSVAIAGLKQKIQEAAARRPASTQTRTSRPAPRRR